MYLTCRVALKPTKEQEAFFFKCANTSRFIYNFSLNLKNEVYEEQGINLKSTDITKCITQLKHTSDYQWLSEIPATTVNCAVRDLDNAFKNFYRGSGYPRFKKKHTTPPSFYTRYDTLYSIDSKHIKICGLKYPVKTYERCLIPESPKNPRIKYDGKYWYLTYGVELLPENRNIPIISTKYRTYQEIHNKEPSDPLGIDLGILHTAVCSNGTVFENINKTPEIQRLERKKKRLQQQISRKYEQNKQGTKFIKTHNIQKQEHQLKLVQRRLNNIRDTYIHQMTISIVKTKPSKIILEDLAISNMMKNHYLARSIQNQRWYEIRRQLEYKSALYNIPVHLAPRFYPSSKICSTCGHLNHNLTLNDRTYVCPNCNLTIDRDLNASLNLSKQ